jgi:hypothetical protein
MNISIFVFVLLEPKVVDLLYPLPQFFSTLWEKVYKTKQFSDRFIIVVLSYTLNYVLPFLDESASLSSQLVCMSFFTLFSVRFILVFLFSFFSSIAFFFFFSSLILLLLLSKNYSRLHSVTMWKKKRKRAAKAVA